MIFRIEFLLFILKIVHSSSCNWYMDFQLSKIVNLWNYAFSNLILFLRTLSYTACPLTNLFEGTCTPRGWILGVQGIF